MEKYKSIGAFCDSTCIPLEQLKEEVIEAVMTLATGAAHSLDTEDIEKISTPLYYFREILERVE